ncbi:Oidioi.mRNA.OKI2018_I69.chr2.g5775.t2.cds [Oikopleura dioica]|uniref:Oidioi.mRNA.OKI2018_I69.chr2.g5775.t2.cds n=1 Tax=Oikopleura dioica TaxID=34765 RepID=A0ABN7T7X7_OIKDI|nr:Oidioi.mRNA.OKI2018_I69.chr2.g5775.t2.cds [Oikopleura dioica]
MQNAENQDGHQTAPMSSDESDAPKTSLRRLTKIIQNQDENEKLNPFGLALAAFILGCCLICPMNTDKSSTVVMYFATG